MDKLGYLNREQAQAADGRREALKWLARQLQWEHRLDVLRPGAVEARQAA